MPVAGNISRCRRCPYRRGSLCSSLFRSTTQQFLQPLFRAMQGYRDGAALLTQGVCDLPIRVTMNRAKNEHFTVFRFHPCQRFQQSFLYVSLASTAITRWIDEAL